MSLESEVIEMLARARELAPPGLPVDFVLADATVYPFEPRRAHLRRHLHGPLPRRHPRHPHGHARRGGRLHRLGRAVVIVTHDNRTLAYADRIVHIEDGRTAESPAALAGEAPSEPVPAGAFGNQDDSTGGIYS